MSDVADETKCKQCGITHKSAHVTYDGYTLPVITKRCVKERKLCDDSENCMTCCIDGGHITELYGKGRHKWKEKSNEFKNND